MEKIINFCKKHIELFTILGLLVICYFVFFFNIGNYALMDVDETRYVSMARDMFNSKDLLTLYLNGEYFFEKPPLYFWGECLSFAIFGKVNEFSARFPVCLYGTMCTFLLYFAGKKIVSRRFGFISAIILATTLEFVMLAKFAILDIVVTTCIGFSVMFGFLTQFVKDENKKYFWWLFYLFSGLAVMAKGIPGFVVPFAVMFFVTLFNKTFKQTFRPQYIIPGILLFLLVVLPWHIVMFKIHNPLFYDEYIIKHHLNRFFSSSEIHRKQPFYFYFLTILWGLIPWVFSAIAVVIAKLKYLKNISFENLNNRQKYFWFNAIAFIVTMLFFSASKTKLITYILPVYFFTSCLIAYIWENFIYNSENKKAINISVYIFGSVCILASIAALFMKFYLPEQLYTDILSLKWFCIILIGIFGISGIVFAKKNCPKLIFTSYVLFMMIISAFGTKMFYDFDYKFGQNDLMNFAHYAKENNKKIAVLNQPRKYSVLYYYGDKVHYISDKDLKKKLAKNSVIIVRNKQISDIEKNVKFDTILVGRKFSLVKIHAR